MRAYYNENDPKAAAWIRELIKEGVISDGEVDERSIEDVIPAELAGFDRCHFFAGIGVWDYALNQAGFAGQVWTGSCPCQPFSAAGKGEGFADERHLWPSWFHLIEVCRPDRIFGEQVSSADGTSWLDLVHSDLEGIGYRIGTLDIPAASVGAPHRRQRLYFVADTATARRRARSSPKSNGTKPAERSKGKQEFKRLCSSDSLGNAKVVNGRIPIQQRGQDAPDSSEFSRAGEINNVADSEDWEQRRLRESGTRCRPKELQIRGRGATNDFWSDAEWIYCRDGKYRPTKPGLFPLANGIAGRVGLLRGFGNCIVAPQAIAFIESYLDTWG